MTRDIRPILVVANPYKETFDAREVARAMASGAARVAGNVLALVGSDGGDGLLDALQAANMLRRIRHYSVSGPLGTSISVDVGWLGKAEAVIESRLVVGLSLVPVHKRSPLVTTTRGLGELISRLAELGARRIYVGLGGSATMDAGLDMARVWGWRALDADARDVPPGGAGLLHLHRVEPGNPPTCGELVGLVDVSNPLLGDLGAAVYAEQKGADSETRRMLTIGLDRLVKLLGVEAMRVADMPGAGAAGGLGFGLSFFGHGSLRMGADWVLDRLRFDEMLSRSRAVMTGEGAFDATSMVGKLTGAVIARARKCQKPVALISPRADHAPGDVVVESGGGRWSLHDIEVHAERAAHRLCSLPAG